MFAIENIHWIGDDDVHEGLAHQINESSKLNDIAEKLRADVLESNALCFFSRETDKKKPKYGNLISAIAAVFYLMKNSNNRPIFLVMDKLSTEETSGFYFFVGHHDEIQSKLEKLCENNENLVRDI